MSHEVIQLIILIKYLKRSHEMIKINDKYLLTTVNKEKTKVNTHMKRHRFETESLSGLYCTDRYESPDHPMSRSSNPLCIGSITSTTLNLP